jgi:ABC-2 type transport system permease protein
MPAWIGNVSRFLPITYALRALRRALLKGTGFRDLLPDMGVLLIFAAILLPLGAVAFRIAVRRARAEGSLVQY